MALGSSIKAGSAYVELFTEQSRYIRGLKAAERRLKLFGQNAQQIGRRMMMAGGLMGAPLALATRIGVGFSDQMLTVKAVIGATGDEFDRLTDKAKKLGRTTSFTAAQVAGGMVELGRAGFSPDEIDNSIAHILNLARATGTELPRAAEIAAGTLRAFNLEADQMGRVSDVMLATANNSAQTMEQLGESMTYAAPIAQEYGLSIEETTKALGVMANMQIKGSMAGTSFRMILLQLSDPAIRKQLQGMGIDLSDFGSTMMGVGEAMAAMSGPERLNFAKQIFGQRAAGAALKLTRDDFIKLGEAIDNAAGSAEKAAGTMDSGLGGAFRRIMSAAEGAALAISGSYEGALQGATKVGTDLIGTITEWIGKNEELVAGYAMTTVGIIAAGAAIFTLGAAASIAGAMLGGIATLLSTLLSPVVLLTAGLATLGGYFLYASTIGQQSLDWLGERFSRLQDRATQTIKGISDALATGDMALAGKILWATLTVEWTRGTGTIKQLWSDSMAFISRTFVEATAMLESVWVRFSNSFLDVWKGAEQGIAAGIAYLIAQAQGLDPEQVLANLGEDYANNRDKREAGRATALAEIERKREATQNEISTDQQRRAREAVADLARLEAERDAALAKAAQQRYEARERIAAGMGGKGGPGSAPPVPGLGTVGDSSRGTFSAFAATLLGMGGNTAADRTAKATEQSAEELGEIKDVLADGTIVWGRG